MSELEHVEVGHHLDTLRQQTENATFYAAAYLAGYSGRTRESYESDLRIWGTWCLEHDVPIMDAARAHVQLWVRELEQAGRAAATIGRKLSAVGGFYSYLVDEDVLRRSPVLHVRRPRVAGESPRFGLDVDELHRLIAAAEASTPQEHALVLLLGLNGLRVSEACGALVDDLATERKHRVLTVLRKGGKRERVPLSTRAAMAVDLAAAGRPGSEHLLQMDRYQAWRAIKRLVDAAGITKTISPHSLRHTFVTLSLDAGVELRDVQDAAGHADPRTTRRYDRGRGNLDRHATYALSDYLDRPK